MRNFLSLLGSVTSEFIAGVKYTIISNLYNVSIIVGFLLPYFMYAIGQQSALSVGKMGIGPEVVIPIIVSILVFYGKGIANRKRKGNQIPVPERRFTEVDEDGEVSMEQSRVSELLLYVADLEDWMAKRGML